METAFCTGCGILTGRVRTNCHRTCPAHAAFGGYKPSGMVRANHKMMLDHRSQTKNLLVSHRGAKLGHCCCARPETQAQQCAVA